MGLWKVLGFTKAAVEVMLSGRDTENIEANDLFACMFFFLFAGID